MSSRQPHTPRPRAFVKYWLPVLVWMAVIFFASGDRRSMEHSSRLIGPLLHWLLPHLSENDAHAVLVGVRKAAHVTEYALLALLIWRALNPAGTGARTWRWRRAAQTLLLVMVYAATDEFHQRFVPSREASVVDVLIDTSGAVLSLLFVWFLGRLVFTGREREERN
jgi:VanZ family protein